jgi:hypothetical protein
MAHFVKLDENNVALAVHVVNNDVITIDGVEVEQAGIDFLTQLHGHTNWKQTSYNGTFRKNYCGIGFTYDSVLDAFIAPKPFNSWSLNEETCLWEAPVAMPADSNYKYYVWNEENQTWNEWVI